MTSPENSGSERSPNSDEDEIPKETLNYCEGEALWLLGPSFSHINLSRRRTTHLLARSSSAQHTLRQQLPFFRHQPLQRLAVRRYAQVRTNIYKNWRGCTYKGQKYERFASKGRKPP